MDWKTMIEATRQYRERLLADPYRPGYHFTVPDGDGRPGDPNGYFYADGRHHLMYLYRRDGGPFCWGHVSSTDLLHWRHHADALTELPGDSGCFSGGAFVDDDGTAYLTYWIFNSDASEPNAGIGLASAKPPYENWTRTDTAIIRSTSWGIREQDGAALGCADPSNIWKRDGVYYIQTGNLCVLNERGRTPDAPSTYRGDWTELFSSKNLIDWVFEGRFYQRDIQNNWTDETEDDMCPSFLPLPTSQTGGAPTDQYLQLFIAHNKGCQYYIGSYTGNRFIPRIPGRMSRIDNAYFAPEAAIDGRGRQIIFAWLLDNLPDDFPTYGWSGVYGLPRSVWLGEDGSLRMAPVPELNALRLHAQRFADRALPSSQLPLSLRNGESCEIQLDVCTEGTAGVLVRASSDGARGVFVGYDAREGTLVWDSTQSDSAGARVRETLPLALANEELAHLTIYVDHSVVEVFANERQAICRRTYPTDEDSRSVFLASDAPARFTRIRAWEMMPSQPY